MKRNHCLHTCFTTEYSTWYTTRRSHWSRYRLTLVSFLTQDADDDDEEEEEEDDDDDEKECTIECKEGEGVKETEVVLPLFFSFTISSCRLSDDRHQQY